jgi:hypothetical protein
VGLPRHSSSAGSGSGHGPFGEKAFKAALAGCVALIVIGALMLRIGGDSMSAVGTSLIALAAVGLLTAGAGALAERLLNRRPPPPSQIRSGNGHSRHPPNVSPGDRDR